MDQQTIDQRIDEIWEGDLLDRKSEAKHVAAYIKSISTFPFAREDKQAYTVAVDAPYGEGKTYFLKRLARQLELEHPVAFVDAWADDMENEPLTALAATLKIALEPFLGEQEMSTKFDGFLSKTGKVAKIAGKGLAKRALSFAITEGAVEGASAVLEGASEEIEEAIDEAASETVNDALDAADEAKAKSVMEKRIREFEEGRAAVEAMKKSLTAIIDGLVDKERSAPVVIIIDELDRCRPTYAIKLLEEIKHLFDVPGLVFVLAMHGEQLGHSVSGAYGTAFDGRAYLRRFIDREYRLMEPNLESLLASLLKGYDIDKWLTKPMLVINQVGEADLTLPQLLAEYLMLYGLGARDAFQMVDILRTSIALSDRTQLILPYFVPLAIGQIKNLPKGTLPNPVRNSKLVYLPNWSRFNRNDSTEATLPELAKSIGSELGKSWEHYHNAQEQEPNSYVLDIARRDEQMNRGVVLYSTPSGYPDLLEAVGRFAAPNFDGAQ